MALDPNSKSLVLTISAVLDLVHKAMLLQHHHEAMSTCSLQTSAMHNSASCTRWNDWPTRQGR